jgi:hypothetical protein
MWGGTNPSIAMRANGTVVFAYLNANGQLWLGQGISPGNKGSATPKLMWGGTSPSIAWGGSPGERQAIAMLGTNGHLYFGTDGASVSDTGENMWGGTSPSVTVPPSGAAFVAFRNQNGLLKILKNTGGTNTTWFPNIASGGNAVNGSPTIYPVGSSGYQVVFKCTTNGHLCIDLNTSGNSGGDFAEDQGWVMN